MPKTARPEAADEAMQRIRMGAKYWSVPGGKPPKYKTSYFRIMPPRNDHPDDTWFWWAGIHNNLPGTNRPVLCPSKHGDKMCEACNLGNELWKAGRKDEARQFFVRWNAMMNVVPLESDGSWPEEPEIMVLRLSKQTMEVLMAKIKELPKEHRNVSDVVEGLNIKIRRTGTGTQDTKYEIDPVLPPVALPEEIIELLEDPDDANLFPLDKLYMQATSHQIVELLEAPKAKALPAPADPFADDEDEDEDTVTAAFREVDDDEDDEEEDLPVAPPPATKVKRQAPAAAAPSAKESDAKARLMARLRGEASASEDEDEDEDEEDDD